VEMGAGAVRDRELAVRRRGPKTKRARAGQIEIGPPTRGKRQVAGGMIVADAAAELVVGAVDKRQCAGRGGIADDADPGRTRALNHEGIGAGGELVRGVGTDPELAVAADDQELGERAVPRRGADREPLVPVRLLADDDLEIL